MKQLIGYCLCFLLSVLLVCSVYAQNQRLEVPVRIGFDDLYMAPIGQKGVVVFNKTRSNVGKGFVEYVFRKYDHHLKTEWTIKGVVKKSLPFIDFAYSTNTLYLLFGKAQSRTYQVVKVNANAGFLEKFELFLLERLEVSHFAASQNDLYVGGMLQGEPAMLHTNLILKKTKILPLSFKGRAYVEAVYLDTLNNFVNATVVSVHRGEPTVLLKSYQKGQEVRSINLPNQKDKYLQDAQVIAIPRNEQLVVGIYAHSQQQKAHQGLFVARLTAQNELKSKRYYSFNDLKNFYGHLSEREQKRIQRKVNRRKKKGKREYTVQDKILLHKIVRQKDTYLLCGDMYIESVRVPGGAFFTPRRFPQNPLPREWEYSRSIGIALNAKGFMQWDNVIKLNRVKVPQIYPVSMFHVGADSSSLTYYFNDELHAKTFAQSKANNEVKSVKLKTSNPDDSIKENMGLQTRRWYGGFYLVWGYQRIKNKRTGKRKVFFVQKMSFASE
ncbi:hypothetical protein [Microscilla marina]|uniref:Uncharacterized protein n=1 Tax=Microscilla marina ATCC 23134 TaxID=313606 RepID=A1ZG81_MICM2|nr:hypothetical protein [Microscilla marina]EAY30498.1 hypothetical protein M23134_03134 [Microscilla marina ATCC 23134]